MKQLRIAVLGSGRIALSTHLPVLSALPAVQLTAIAEPDPGLRQKALALAPGVKVFSDWREAVVQKDVDAVVICLPSALHAEAGIAAFEAGKHVYLEKPIACELADATRVLHAWKASGCIGMTGFNYRFDPLAVELRRQIQSGRIGKVIGVQSVFCTHADDLPGWKAERKTGGGVLLDLASHHIDLYRYLLNSDLQSVHARVTSIKSEADTASLDLRNMHGVGIHSLFSLRSLEQNTIEIFGTQGKLSLDFYRSTTVKFAGAGRGDSAAQIADIPAMLIRRGKKVITSKLNPAIRQLTWRLALTEFVASIQESRKPSCDLNDGFASLAVIDAAERSAVLKAPVDLAKDTFDLPASELVAGALATPDPHTAAMSVILATPGSATAIAATLRALRAQTIYEQLELVLVVHSEARLDFKPYMAAGFYGLKIVEAGEFRSIAHADALGVRAASAPIVAFAEDHAFPEPGWAAALIQAHRGPWAAVGPLIANANPGTRMSCADLLLGYGPWLDPELCGARSHLPGHNSSYKRQVLLDYGSELEAMLEAETLLQWDMCSRGLQLFQAREACTRHTNFSLPIPFAEASFSNGRAFGAARAAHWSGARRAFFALASPLIPFVRFYKIFRDARGSAALRTTLYRAVAALAFGLFLDGLGQMLGYALGPGNSTERLKKIEFDRASNINPRDREMLFGSVQNVQSAEGP